MNTCASFWSAPSSEPPVHGGRLNTAVATSNIARSEWLDLSAALNPTPYPVPPIAQSQWQCLPEDDDGLIDIAQQYYQQVNILPVAGSQQAIQLLANTANQVLRVGVLAHSYSEHAHCWQQAGHRVISLMPDNPLIDPESYYQATISAVDWAIAALDILIIVNPNNPTGQSFSLEQLQRWQQRLLRHGGVLLVDEAFIDCEPQLSLCTQPLMKNTIILRSLGKFFGMAGARVGFLIGDHSLLQTIRYAQGPWPIATPCRAAAIAALADKNWQNQTRSTLGRQAKLLNEFFSTQHISSSGCALFQYFYHPAAAQLFHALQQQAVLARFYPDYSALRFAIPALQDANTFSKRFISALNSITTTTATLVHIA